MNYPENNPSDDRNENPTLVSPPSSSSSYLTRDQEHKIVVSTLRQVISNSGGETSSSNSIPENTLPSPNAGPCPLCDITGCHGCAFQRPPEDIKEKKHRGVRKKPSGKWSAEIWDPNLRVRRWLGMFPTFEMAAHAYDEAATELVGRLSTRSGTNN